MARTNIPYSGYGGQGLQVFTPTRIETIAPAGSLDVSGVACIRVSTSTAYQMNGTGVVGNMPAGCTGIGKNTTSFTFPNGSTVEVM